MGWEKTHSNNLLIELYAEDLSHLGIFLLVIDPDCNIRDFLYLEEPINGDQIEYKDNFSIEWHYKANFKLHKDTIIAHQQSIDIKLLVSDKTFSSCSDQQQLSIKKQG